LEFANLEFCSTCQTYNYGFYIGSGSSDVQFRNFTIGQGTANNVLKDEVSGNICTGVNEIDQSVYFLGHGSPAYVQTNCTGLTNRLVGPLAINGSTSGALKVTTQAVAGTPTWTAGTNSGTPAVTATTPLAISSLTGNLTLQNAASSTVTAAIGTDTSIPTASGSFTNTGVVVGDSGGGITGNSKMLVSSGGKLTTYNNLTTAGLGVPAILMVLNQTGVSTANSGVAQNILSSTPAAGHYRVTLYLDQSLGCLTVGSGKVAYVIGWTDPNGSRNTPSTTMIFTVSASANTQSSQLVTDMWTTVGSAITVTDNYTGCSSSPSATYDQHITVEELQ
jgi:hypothetical protein